MLAGHAPLIALLRRGLMTVYAGHGQTRLVVLGAFAESRPDGLAVLADVATSLEDLDRDTLQAQMSKMEQDVKDLATRLRARPVRLPGSIISSRWEPGTLKGTANALTRRAKSRGEFRERVYHSLVDVAFERHHQVREIRDRLPAPFDELWIVPAAGVFDVDLAVFAGEAQRIHFCVWPRYFPSHAFFNFFGMS